MTPLISQFQYLAPEDVLSPFSTNFSIHDPISVLHMTNFLTNIPDYFSSHPSSLSYNSTSDEAEEQKITDTITERKRRRMISNRESARRSRIRKQKQLDELLLQLSRLRIDNQSLMEHLKHLIESHEIVVEENARLKEETIDIRRKLDEMQLGNISSDIEF